MRTRHAGQAVARPTGAVRARLAPFSGVVVLLAGLGFLLTPGTPAGAAPPSQGYTATEAPLPNDANANPNVYTATTTCPVPNGCVVVGWYSDTANRPWGLIEQQNGTTWTDTRAPQPNNAGSGTNQGLWLGSQQCGILGFEQLCHAVACPTATTCYAVGQYLDTAGNSEPVIETLSNGIWSSTEAPLPANPPPATDGGPNLPDAFLMSVSCVSVTSCVAVGQYRDSSGNIQGLITTAVRFDLERAGGTVPLGPERIARYGFTRRRLVPDHHFLRRVGRLPRYIEPDHRVARDPGQRNLERPAGAGALERRR